MLVPEPSEQEYSLNRSPVTWQTQFSHTLRQRGGGSNQPNVHASGLWMETGVLGENPHRKVLNSTQTQKQTPFNQTRYQNLTLCMNESSIFTYQNIHSTSKTLFSLLFYRLSNLTAQCRDCGLMNDGNDMACWMKRSDLSGVFFGFFLYHLGSSSSILLPTSDISLTVLLDC